MELYNIREVGFTYSLGETPALAKISTQIRQGEFVVLCGHSGGGKSTFLRLLKPSVAPEGTLTGEISFCGKPLEEVPERSLAAEIGFVMQNPENQAVCDKVWQELAFGLESLGVPTGEIRTRVAEMAAFFGMESWFRKKVSELSGGQKQLLNLASAMVMKPKVLILDEPTGQLDPIAAREFLQTLSRLNQELGTTVILSEHRLEEAIPLADRVLVLEEGTLIADDVPEEMGRRLVRHPMFRAMPVPIRIHQAVEPETPSPVTVGEGRLWLERYAEKCGVDTGRIPPREKEPHQGEPILQAKEVWFRYRKTGEDVLRGFSAEIHRGEWYALLGGNGAGKTTALSVMAGLEKPERGKVLLSVSSASGEKVRVGVLPQDPRTLFVHKTVQEELLEMAEGENAEKQADAMAELCGISHLYSRHPYDLSGGEQQRVALGKLLLSQPEILFLDEPTKGMDAAFKEEFGDILLELKGRGITLVMVSHDIEFCAKYTDRCGLLFDGAVTDQDIPEVFFAGKSFYTTAAGRMVEKVLPGVILAEDVILACGGSLPEEARKREKKLPPPTEETPPVQKPNRGKWVRYLLGVFTGILFWLTCRFLQSQPAGTEPVLLQILSILEAGLCLTFFFPSKGKEEKIMPCRRVRVPRRTWLGALWGCAAVPLTIYLGMAGFGDRRYYLISVLVLLETLVPFFLLWERQKNTARELVFVSVLAAISVAGRGAFSMIPQFKPVLALVILTGICFGGEAGFLVGAVTAFVSNFFLGQGPWTPWQMLATGLVGFLAGILFGSGFLPQKRWILCAYGFFGTILLYGGIMNPISVILYQEAPTWEMIGSAILMGLPYDVIHGASTVFFLWVLQKPMGEKLSRVKQKYGIGG